MEIEKRRFKVHENTIYHLIKSQSGSVTDALKELIQNSIDANATKVEITITHQGFKCIDDGDGFKDRNSIINFFETFGTPYTVEDNKVFGRFRMGRGQIMAHSKTSWNSNNFNMQVDIREKGLEYDLKEDIKAFKGCCISGEWYESLNTNKGSYNSPEDIARDLLRVSKFINPTRVVINGEQANIDFNNISWDYEDEYFYYHEKKNAYSFSIFNLGILTSNEVIPELPKNKGGLIITKKHLNLNTSRNNILQNCELWAYIKDKLIEINPIEIKSKRLKTDEITSLIYQVYNDRIPIYKIFDAKIFISNQTNKRYSIQDISKSKTPFVFSDTRKDKYKIASDKIEQRKLAVVLSTAQIEEALYDHTEGVQYIAHILFFNKIINYVLYKDKGFEFEGREAIDLSYLGNRIKQFSEFYNSVMNDDGTSLILDEDLTVKQKLALRAINKSIKLNIKKLPSEVRETVYGRSLKRKLFLGESQNSLGWTDGENFIAINYQLVDNLKHGLSAADKIVSIYIHELCHEKDLTDVHDLDFYRLYHDITVASSSEKQNVGIISTMANDINKFYYSLLMQNSLRPTKSMEKTIKEETFSFYQYIELVARWGEIEEDYFNNIIDSYKKDEQFSKMFSALGIMKSGDAGSAEEALAKSAYLEYDKINRKYISKSNAKKARKLRRLLNN